MLDTVDPTLYLPKKKAVPECFCLCRPPDRKVRRTGSCSRPSYHSFASDSSPPITGSRVGHSFNDHGRRPEGDRSLTERGPSPTSTISPGGAAGFTRVGVGQRLHRGVRLGDSQLTDTRLFQPSEIGHRSPALIDASQGDLARACTASRTLRRNPPVERCRSIGMIQVAMQ